MATRVLIVDDDRSFRRAAAMLLRARGFEVVGEAADGREAIAAIEALQPEAVLLDVHLPDGDGLELARRLSPEGWGPRVLLTSSDVDAASQELAECCGAAGFVAKTELASTGLERYLRK